MVILSEQVGSYPKINWTEWKDRNRKHMKSQGDVWSMATLSGATIWDCLDNNKIDRLHLVQWKPVDDTMYQVSAACPSRDCRRYLSRGSVGLDLPRLEVSHPLLGLCELHLDLTGTGEIGLGVDS